VDSSRKLSTEKENKIHEISNEVQDLRTQLRAEKEKVKNLTDWKIQLVEKNKLLKDENDKLMKRGENLELLMSDEVTDINEMIKVINNIQAGKDARNPAVVKKRYS